MTLAEQYADLKAQEKTIKEQLEDIGEKLLAHMKEQQIGTIKAEYGTFSKAQKFVYEYSDEFKTKEKEMKDNLKVLKEEEEKTLEPKIMEYLTFRAAK